MVQNMDVVLKRFEQPDEVRTFERGKFEIVWIGGMTIGRATYEPGWKWSLHVGPATGASSCSSSMSAWSSLAARLLRWTTAPSSRCAREMSSTSQPDTTAGWSATSPMSRCIFSARTTTPTVTKKGSTATAGCSSASSPYTKDRYSRAGDGKKGRKMPVKVRMERVAPILPVRDVTAALAHYRQLGFDVQAYGPPGEANPEYGFVRRGDVELHLSLPRSTTPRSRRATATSMSAMPTPSMPPGRPPMLPPVFRPPGDTPYRLREFAYVDPEGNLLRRLAPPKGGGMTGERGGMCFLEFAAIGPGVARFVAK